MQVLQRIEDLANDQDNLVEELQQLLREPKLVAELLNRQFLPYGSTYEISINLDSTGKENLKALINLEGA